MKWEFNLFHVCLCLDLIWMILKVLLTESYFFFEVCTQVFYTCLVRFHGKTLLLFCFSHWPLLYIYLIAKKGLNLIIFLKQIDVRSQEIWLGKIWWIILIGSNPSKGEGIDQTFLKNIIPDWFWFIGRSFLHFCTIIAPTYVFSNCNHYEY